jgi:hypothetical protein
MFHDINDVRSIKKSMKQLAHGIGLSAEVFPSRDSAFIDYKIELSMNQQRFNSYCHREGAKLVMSENARMNQMLTERKMIHEFWTTLLGELRKARCHVDWFYYSEQVQQVHHIRQFDVAEMKLEDSGLQDRVIRIHMG